MADSDNSTSRYFVTRRRLLAGTMVGTATWLRNARGLASDLPRPHTSSDPALVLWRKWQAAHNRTERLCRKQQRLETTLAKRVGFPSAMVRLPGGEHKTIFSIAVFDEVLGDEVDAAAIREKAEADFTAAQARWDAADAELGYSASLRAERDAADQAQELAEALSATPAASLAGVAGKLDAVLCEGEAWEECSEFPWPHIRSALNDLVRIAQQMMPGQAVPDHTRRRSASKHPGSRLQARL